MKDVFVLIGVFAAGYVFTMGLLFVAIKLFFPFKPVEGQGVENIVSMRKASGSPSNRDVTKLRKVRLANG